MDNSFAPDYNETQTAFTNLPDNRLATYNTLHRFCQVGVNKGRSKQSLSNHFDKKLCIEYIVAIVSIHNFVLSFGLLRSN